MIVELGLSRTLMRLAAIAVVAIGASACSAVPNWVDPTNWIGNDDQTASTSGEDQTPDLANIPNKPAPPSTVDERKQVADSLKADRADANYSADALRGGTEAPAAAPPDSSASAAEVATSTATPRDSGVPDQSTSNTQTASADANNAPAASAAPTANAAPAMDQSATPQAAPATQVASTEQPASTTEASVAPTPAAPAAVSDDQLGFQSSKAPPLDAAVAKFVPQTTLDRYQRNSTNASAAGWAPAAPILTPPADPPKADAPQKSSAIDPPAEGHASRRVASADGASLGTSTSHMLTPAAYMPSKRSQPAAVVFFPESAAALSAKSKAQILAAAQSFQTHGTSGFVRVVGHSSSRTGDMPMARHLELVFERSQEYAAAVANELVRDGVPADKVLIEAVGDSQPVYYESMPQGEEGNRRTEIFL